MEIAVRQSYLDRRSVASHAHRCPQCHTDALLMHRRHVSPARWGEPVVTEYYDCEYCDAKYTYSPAEDRWKVIYQ